MIHPTPQEMTAFLYGELSSESQTQLRRHLEGCPECANLVASLQRTRAQLQIWRLPAPAEANLPAPHFGRPALRMLKAAAVVAVLIGVGFGLARLAGPSASENARLRAEISSQLTEPLTQQIRAELKEFADSQAKREQQYRAAIIRAIGHLEAQRAIELAGLRQDVETVAMNTQDELETTQAGLYELAAFEPRKLSNP